MKSLLHLALLALGLATFAGALPAAHAPRHCGGAPVGKRGISYNDAQVTRYFRTDRSKIVWMYNWNSATEDNTPNTGFEYVPMLWSNEAGNANRWFGNVERQVNVFCGRYALSFNEPDLCGSGGSCINDVGVAVAGFKQWMQPLVDRYGSKLKIGSPAVTNGGAPMGLDYLKRFIAACTGCRIDFVPIHWYDSATNIEYFKSHIKAAYEAGGGRPVWITEFGPQGDVGQQIEFLKQVLPWLDSQGYVEKYAMFMAAPGRLVKADGSGLSDLGDVYSTY